MDSKVVEGLKKVRADTEQESSTKRASDELEQEEAKDFDREDLEPYGNYAANYKVTTAEDYYCCMKITTAKGIKTCEEICIEDIQCIS
ncbi:hypothetical protein Tco_0849034 [Tanacetum coccineum]